MGLAFILDNNIIYIYTLFFRYPLFLLVSLSKSRCFVAAAAAGGVVVVVVAVAVAVAVVVVVVLVLVLVLVVVVDTSFLMLTSSAFLHHLFFDHRGYAFGAEHGGLFGCGAESGALASGEDGD